MVGVDVSKAKHDACMGTHTGIICVSFHSRIHALDLSGLKMHQLGK